MVNHGEAKNVSNLSFHVLPTLDMSATEVRPYFDRDPLLFFWTPKQKKNGDINGQSYYIYICLKVSAPCWT